MGGIKYLIQGLADILWPPVCHICGSLRDADMPWLCRRCLEHLPRAHFSAWQRNPMTLAMAGKIPFERAAAFLIYNPKGVMREVFHDFKYRGFSRLAKYMGVVAARDLEMASFFNGIDYLTPVPLYWQKRLHRGYNQSELIARGLGMTLNIPVSESLKATLPHFTQTGMNAEQRAANTRGIFSYRPAPAERGRNICIVDDVFTTGSTLLSCAATILSADPEARLSFFTLAYTSG